VSTVTLKMVVHKYIPSKLYGFAVDDAGLQVFFHLGVFSPGGFDADDQSDEDCQDWQEAPPPPILGEEVEVEFDSDLSEEGKAPRAIRVSRFCPPKVISGLIETFDSHRGYGFVIGSDGISYHLHKSEVLDGRVPLASQKVKFYAGIRQSRPRACHVKICL